MSSLEPPYLVVLALQDMTVKVGQAFHRLLCRLLLEARPLSEATAASTVLTCLDVLEQKQSKESKHIPLHTSNRALMPDRACMSLLCRWR